MGEEVYMAPFTLTVFLGLAAPVAMAAPSDPAPCLGALAKTWAPALESSWAGGALPRVVKYNRPHRDLIVWKRRDGTLLVLDGAGIQQVPSFEGPANGRTFVRDAGAPAEITLAPSTYRKVSLEDGRSFELHRAGKAGAEALLLRGEDEDAAAVAFEEERQIRRELVALDRFAENFARAERVCENSALRFSERSFAEQLGGILEAIVKSSRPDYARSEPSDAVRAEVRFLELDVEALREARRRKALVKGWKDELKAMAPERAKPENALRAQPLAFDPASAAALLKEAAADFSKHVSLEKLGAEAREALAVCGDFLELPAAVKAKP